MLPAFLLNVEKDAANEAPVFTPLAAFLELRKLGDLSDIIPDSVAWQREQRTDRPLPGCE